MPNTTDDLPAGLRAWARRAKAAGLGDMREALNTYAIEVERLQDKVRNAEAAEAERDRLLEALGNIESITRSQCFNATGMAERMREIARAAREEAGHD
jgi:hypothetical protein